MENIEAAKKPSSSSNKLIIALILVILAAAGAVIFTLNKKDDDGVIGYAAEATVMLDENSLQAAMDEAVENAKNSRVGLRYQNDAYSDDGINFECTIANSASNIYDMFLTIFADSTMDDQIFLSGLVPPGSGFEQITLEHALDPGDHTVYVVLTQVTTDENGEQVIQNQVTHTMDFHVSE